MFRGSPATKCRSGFDRSVGGDSRHPILGEDSSDFLAIAGERLIELGTKRTLALTDPIVISDKVPITN
jgi:hypothetical protein